ncbi:hypothetical protein NLI96_g4953 [Meripilus lineatus]|uniref:Uncharacterized protein n=1 Tax=Meripilus lineatus TaxID=2056292 RepID=A0AAD5YJK9_9APHY|nr:hypothetical protein NLI96_g4953 [Physisporinus lineatus]
MLSRAASFLLGFIVVLPLLSSATAVDLEAREGTGLIGSLPIVGGMLRDPMKGLLDTVEGILVGRDFVGVGEIERDQL